MKEIDEIPSKKNESNSRLLRLARLTTAHCSRLFHFAKERAIKALHSAWPALRAAIVSDWAKAQTFLRSISADMIRDLREAQAFLRSVRSVAC